MRTILLAGGLAATLTTPLFASPPERSLRPEARNLSVVQRAVGGMVDSLRPAARRDGNGPVTSGNWTTWQQSFRARAQAQGIRADVLDRAFRGVSPSAEILKLDRNQAEFSKPIWDYLDSAVSATRIKNGKAALARHRGTLEAIEARYGVDKEVVVAIWGLESAFGSYRGKTDVITALATLAFDGRRATFFEAQLVAALQILQAGDVSPRAMKGSWAGAMGHTQFMPTSYLEHAVDFRGDGKRDIWSDNPEDALASTAAYLKEYGWRKGQPWGVEVQLPRGFNYSLARRDVKRSPADWAGMGVRDMNGRQVPNHGKASILLPAGAQGVAFMIFQNFSVIERYNSADAYVIGVGHLSDRIAGGRGFAGTWPRADRGLSSSEKQEMQKRLTALGFDTKGVDGRIGPKTIAAVRAFQKARGLLPDGYASLALLQKLR